MVNSDAMEVTIEHGTVSICDDGIGLKIIDDICRLLAITYELQTNEKGTGFLFSKE